MPGLLVIRELIAPLAQAADYSSDYGQWQPPPHGTAVIHPAEQAQAPVQAAPITPDADGYAACPVCGGRVKVGRRSCMSCGSALA